MNESSIDAPHRPGCVRWLHCDRCLGYKTRHWPEGDGLRCEGCHELRPEKNPRKIPNTKKGRVA